MKRISKWWKCVEEKMKWNSWIRWISFIINLISFLSSISHKWEFELRKSQDFFWRRIWFAAFGYYLYPCVKLRLSERNLEIQNMCKLRNSNDIWMISSPWWQSLSLSRKCLRYVFIDHVHLSFFQVIRMLLNDYNLIKNLK
jgi:hypothetical protein